MSMAVPPMVSMLIQSMYNIVDSIFVARLGEEALTAVSLAYPLQNLVLAVAVGLGVGANAGIARNLGAKNQDRVDRIAAHTISLRDSCDYFYYWLEFFCTKPFLQMFTQNENVLRWGCEYSYIVICLSLRKFVPYCDRKDVSVLWKYGDSDGDAGTRCDYQYYFRSDHDIRLFRIPGTRGKRSGDRNGDRAICSMYLFCDFCLWPDVKKSRSGLKDFVWIRQL